MTSRFLYIVESQRDKDQFPQEIPEVEEWDEDSCISEEPTAEAVAQDAVCYAEFMPNGYYYKPSGQTIFVRDLEENTVISFQFTNEQIRSLENGTIDFKTFASGING